MQVEKEREEQETQIDMEAATASISEDLFGNDEDEGNVSAGGPEGDSGAETVETPLAQPKEGEAPSAKEKAPEGEAPTNEETSAEVQAVGAPKTWTKEAVAAWATIPEGDAKKIIGAELAKREEDFFRGISGYKAAAELGSRYDQVVEPYRAALAAENIDPVGLFQAFAANHYLLARGTPEQKVELVANLLNGYGIPLEAVASFISDAGVAPVDPEILALRREIAELRSGVTQQFNNQREATLGNLQGQINAFADDGQHPYFDEVAEDIARFVEMGAESLQDAYDRAVFANPVTRQKEIDRLTAEALSAKNAEEKTRKDKQSRSMAEHVKTTPTSRNGTVPLGSMDDTLEEKFREISERSE